MARHGAEKNKPLRQRRLALVRDYKERRGCERCGETHPATLQLHHVDPSTKHPRLTRRANGKLKTAVGWHDLSYVDIQTELRKCLVLCANCHAIEEWERRQLKFVVERAESSEQLELEWMETELVVREDA